MCQFCNNKIIENNIKSLLILGKLSEKEIINKIVADVRKDVSLPILQDLLSQNYSKVKWISSDSDYAKNDTCYGLNGQEWDLQSFINETNYDAPIFSKTHPQCLCYLEVYHSDGITMVKVNYAGVMS
jgi:uncharacterized protein YqiB (DUF1249 family)